MPDLALIRLGEEKGREGRILDARLGWKQRPGKGMKRVPLVFKLKIKVDFEAVKGTLGAVLKTFSWENAPLNNW